MTRAHWLLGVMAALSLGAACTDDPNSGAARAGSVSLRLTTPYADDGALLFEVSGPQIDSARAVNGSLQLFTRRVGSSTLAGVVVGAVANGTVVTLQVPDVGAAAGYSARVIEVADRHDALRASLTGYTLAVVP
jgi:hypothetical protein